MLGYGKGWLWPNLYFGDSNVLIPCAYVVLLGMNCFGTVVLCSGIIVDWFGYGSDGLCA